MTEFIYGLIAGVVPMWYFAREWSRRNVEHARRDGFENGKSVGWNEGREYQISVSNRRGGHRR